MEDRSCKQNEFEGLRPSNAIRDHLVVVNNLLSGAEPERGNGEPHKRENASFGGAARFKDTTTHLLLMIMIVQV